MGFLDSLENNLKALESQEDRKADQEDQQKRRESERASALAIGPWADQLKNGPYTEGLLVKAAEAGHKVRAKVNMTWIGNTLRLQVRERKLELRPTADGVVAAFVENGHPERVEPIDLAGDPSKLVEQWLGDSL